MVFFEHTSQRAQSPGGGERMRQENTVGNGLFAPETINRLNR